MNIEYNNGRFFVSPIIGCNGQCTYCYLNTKLSNSTIRKNSLRLKDIFQDILLHPEYIRGKNGSIISIGAWGDIFPKNNNKLLAHSVAWIKKLLSLGNPIQIMSKFFIEKEIVDEICRSIKYDNQLLYSTTITTFKEWTTIEPYTISPEERLTTISSFKQNFVKTNVMIKPFLSGITDKEEDLFEKYFTMYKPDYCVVGILYCNDEIKSRLSYRLKDATAADLLHATQILDCTGSLDMDTISTKDLNGFISNIQKLGVRVFKKSSCVTANIIGTKNIANYSKYDPGLFCVNCGNCI